MLIRILFYTVFLSLCANTSALHADTLAILATNADGESVVELAGVELSKSKNLELLERSRVAEILHEQELSAVGNGSDSLRLGRLLGVELFAVWEQRSTEQAGRVVVFDGTTGVRVADQEIEAVNLDLLVTAFVEQVKRAMRKRVSLAKSKLRLVSLVSIRNVDLPPDWRLAEEKIIAQLEQSLTQSPSIGLLERERLRFVLEEEMLPVAQTQARLLSSADLITVQLSRKGAKAVQLELLLNRPEESRPQKIVKTAAIDASPAELEQSIESIAPLVAAQVGLATLTGNDTRVAQKEWQVLKTEAMRHSAARQPFLAAVRFEAAYALSDDADVLKQLILAINQSILANVRLRMFRPMQRRRSGRPIENSDEEWKKISRLAEYQVGLRRKLHEFELQKPDWPFDADSSSLANGLSFDFSFSQELGPKTRFPDRPGRPAVGATEQLKQAYAKNYRLVFDEFSTDARARLTGDSLERFEAALANIELRWLTISEDRYSMPNWDHRLVSVLTRCLKDQQWLSRMRVIEKAILNLPSATRDKLLNAFARFDPQQNVDSHLGVRHLQLRIRENSDGFTYSGQFEAAVRQLVVDIVDRMGMIEDVTQPPDLKTVNAPGFSFQQRRFQDLLSNVMDRTLWLIPDIKVRRGIYVDAFLKLLENNILDAHLLSKILQPDYLYYVPEDEALLKQIIAVVEEKSLGLSAQKHQTLLNVLEARRQRVAVPWEGRRRGGVTHLKMPWAKFTEVEIFPKDDFDRSILATNVASDEVFVLALKKPSMSPGSRRLPAYTDVEMYRLAQDAEFKPVLMGQLNLSSEYTQKERSARKERSVSGRPSQSYFCSAFSEHMIVASPEHIFARTEAGGILVFPRDGTAAFRIDSSWGLSSHYVQQLLPLEDRLLAWVGEERLEANFVSIDLRTREIQTLASCQRKDPKTPLDDLPRANCSLLMSSPDGDRVTMVIEDGYDPQAQYGNSQRNGVWQFDLNSHEFARLPVNVIQGHSYSRVGESVLAIGQSVSGVFRCRWQFVDLNDNQIDELGDLDLYFKIRPIAANASAVWWHNRYADSCYRLDRKTGKRQQLRIVPLDHPGQTEVQFFDDVNRAVICTTKQLWIAELKSEP